MKKPNLTQGQAGQSNINTQNYNAVEKLLHRLQKVKPTGKYRWTACCPAHEDRTPSLSIAETGGGTVLVKCFAGCNAWEITAAVGLELRDLFPPTPYRWRPPADGLTAAKRREYRAILEQESHLVRFARAAMAEGQTLSPEDAQRALLADERVRKLKGALLC